MKVISRTETGHLVDISLQELRQLSGEKSLGYQGYHSTDYVKNGTEIEISKIYSQALSLIESLNDVTKAQILLRKVADNIEPIKPIIEKIINKEDSNGSEK